MERQIGRLLERNARAVARYTISFEPDDSLPAGGKRNWRTQNQWEDWAQLSEGTYLLGTNIESWTPDELWKTYVQLTDAEAAFRIHKSDLSLRPIWHQRADRIRAHILVCFLAYVIWKTLEQCQKRAGLGNSPRSILKELGRIQSADVVLPLADGSERRLRIRYVVQADKAQGALLDRRGLQLAQCLRIPSTVDKM